jgi:hypothetical protein
MVWLAQDFTVNQDHPSFPARFQPAVSARDEYVILTFDNQPITKGAIKVIDLTCHATCLG